MLNWEAEYIALKEAAETAMFLVQLFKYIGVCVTRPIICCESTSAITLAKHPINHRNLKHFSIQQQFIRDLVNIIFVL